jgi:hypothetical protein
MSFYYIIEYIVRTSIITYNSPKLFYNTIILKDREKNSKLLLSSIVCYYTKYKEGLPKLLLIINKIDNNS